MSQIYCRLRRRHWTHEQLDFTENRISPHASMNPLKLEPSLNPLKMDRVDEGRLKAGLFLYPTLLSLLSPFQYLLRVVKNLHQCPLGVVKFFMVPFIKCFLTDFGPIVTDLPSVFHLTLIWSCKAASKSEAPKSTLLYKSCSNQKILVDLLLKLLKLV